MKKIIYNIILLSVLTFYTATAQEKKPAWDFPVNSKSKEWANLKSVEEQFDAYNIPDGIIGKISTEELVKTCMSYPEWGLIHAYNDRYTGLSVIVSLFNGFRELLGRDDAATELMKVYAGIDPLAVDPGWTDLQKGEYGFRFTRLELFLSLKPVIGKLDENGIRTLNEIAVSKYRQKKMLPKIYSLWDLSPTAGICLSILERDAEHPAVKDNSAIRDFKRDLMTDDIRVPDEIVRLSETKR
jgi:hypothetical protein